MRFTARCLCGPRVRPVNIAFDAHHAIATDAHQKGGRADPTGTMPLQQRWNRALDQRWAGLKRLIPQAIENHVNPIQAIAHSAITGRPDAISASRTGWTRR
jgi:hypothetical protein